jgi:DNA-binding transcriptional MerR regulator
MNAGDGLQAEPPVYSIGDLSVVLGISPRAIRFYEDQGMLSPRRVGGNRIYGQRDLARLKLIVRGKRLGFTLSDIRELLDLYDVDQNHLEQLRQALVKGRARIAELEQQQVELTLTLQEMRDLETVIVNCINQRETGAATPPARNETAEESPTS